MEVSLTQQSAFQILTEDAVVLIDSTETDASPDDGVNQIKLNSHFKPSSDIWKDSDMTTISELGEYEIGSVYITAIPSVQGNASDVTNTRVGIDDIDILYAVDANNTRLCVIGSAFSEAPDKRAIEQLSHSLSGDIVVFDLARSTIDITAFANFIRGLETKQLIVNVKGDDPKLVNLAKELGIEKITPLGVAPIKSLSTQERLSLIALTTR